MGVIYDIFLHLVIVSNVYTQEDLRNCGTGYSKCCAGYTWSFQEDQCILSPKVCTPGYNGPNCSLTCPYPLFGLECQMKCECEEAQCNISIGCIKETTVGSSQQSTSAPSTNYPMTILVDKDDIVSFYPKKLFVSIIATVLSVFVCIIVINNVMWIWKIKTFHLSREKKKIEATVYQELQPQDSRRNEYMDIVQHTELYSGAANVCVKFLKGEDKYEIEIYKTRKTDLQNDKHEETLSRNDVVLSQDTSYEEPL